MTLYSPATFSDHINWFGLLKSPPISLLAKPQQGYQYNHYTLAYSISLDGRGSPGPVRDAHAYGHLPSPCLSLHKQHGSVIHRCPRVKLVLLVSHADDVSFWSDVLQELLIAFHSFTLRCSAVGCSCMAWLLWGGNMSQQLGRADTERRGEIETHRW